jgi:hypothetical protein
VAQHSSDTTTDHEEIRKWAEARGGAPASVEGTGDGGEPGVLRIEFRDDDDRLDEVDWADFSRKFDDEKLAFLYQDRTSDGEISRFHKFIRRDESGS